MEAIINPNKKAPEIFKNKFLNLLTWSHPVLIFAMYGLISTVLVYVGIVRFELSGITAIGLFFTGLFAWTLGEYLMHRFLYHEITDAGYDKGFRYVFHGVHHRYPNDGSKVVLPPVPSIIIAAIFFGIFYLLMGKYTWVFGPGFMMGYSIYMWIHYAVHHYPSPRRFNFWWRHHNIHHYQQHDRAFGVSTAIWDHVFRTMPEAHRKTIKIVVDRTK